MSSDMDKLYHEYIQRENEFSRAGYQPEFEFYSAVKMGDVEKVKELCKDAFSDKKGLGVLSDDPVQNLRYHLVITTAMIARYCIEGGMELSDSYSLSDYYIRKVDKAKTEKEVTDIHKEMSLDYAKKMRNLQKKMITSLPVAKSVDYIYEHLHTRIKLDDLAEYVGVNPSYLSRQFKAVFGTSISSYIRRKKIETAQNMLLYSDFTLSQIASILAFPSQSYFTDVFRKETGITPNEYKKRNLFSNDLRKNEKK